MTKHTIPRFVLTRVLRLVLPQLLHGKDTWLILPSANLRMEFLRIPVAIIQSVWH